jgi:hypothetical protein
MADPTTAFSRPEPKQQESGRDFGRLSRRIAGWTTNGLATALVILAGLTLGRQVLIWWKETPATPSAGGARDGAPAPETGIRQLEFGALATTVQTRQVRGTRQEVLLQLRELCRPAARPESPADASAPPAERRLLAELAGKDPAESGDGWRIDELPQGLPLVVCSTSVERSSFPSKSKPGAAGNGMNSVLPSPLDPRIVSIGLAVPGREGQWTAYAFRVDGAASAASGDTAIPLPPGSRTVMTVRQPDGSVLTTFRGISEASAWEQHFRTAPPEKRWRILGNPLKADVRWQAEFVQGGAKPLRAQVHFEYDGQGGLHGLVLVSPAGEP